MTADENTTNRLELAMLKLDQDEVTVTCWARTQTVHASAYYKCAVVPLLTRKSRPRCESGDRDGSPDLFWGMRSDCSTGIGRIFASATLRPVREITKFPQDASIRRSGGDIVVEVRDAYCSSTPVGPCGGGRGARVRTIVDYDPLFVGDHLYCRVFR